MMLLESQAVEPTKTKRLSSSGRRPRYKPCSPTRPAQNWYPTCIVKSVGVHKTMDMHCRRTGMQDCGEIGG